MALSKIKRSGVVNPPDEYVGLVADQKPINPIPWSTYRELDGDNIWEWQTRDGGTTWGWYTI
jgi:hypothetical protein